MLLRKYLAKITSVLYFQKPETDPHVILFSLIALEKFAQTTEYKSTIIKKLQSQQPSPIEALETWSHESHYVKRQVGFCAQWVLDNLCMFYKKLAYIVFMKV